MSVILIVGAVFLSLLFWNILKGIICSYTSPLSLLPSAGWGAAYSRLLWAFPQEYCGTITLELPKLHRQIGPLIRIAPNEVSFYSIDVYDLVHKVKSGFEKDARNYGQFVQNGHPALFSITCPEDHAKRRRIMGQLFNRSKMPNLEGLMCCHVSKFIRALGEMKDAIDLIPACRALEADIISEFSFGKSLKAITAWKRGEFLVTVSKNDEKATWMPLLTNFPVIYNTWNLLEHFVCRVSGRKTSYHEGLRQFDQWAYDAWNETLRIEKPTESPFPNLIRTLVRSGLPPRTALSEAKENLGPGTDTTSGSLAHILFALAKNPLYQENMYRDLLETGFSTDISVLENIPRLKACVKEGIRWAGSATAMLPRIVPDGGIELYGKIIPGGTILTSSPTWYLRDEYAFPEPDMFDPYRWIDESGSALREDTLRDKFYIPFSKGTNVCMGIHFSYYELYLSVSQLIKHFYMRPTCGNYDSPPVYNTNHHDWYPVSLPVRKEWVAAVITDKLLVTVVPRKTHK